MNRGLTHTIEHYERTILRYKESGKPLLLSFVGPMENTLKGLYRIKDRIRDAN